MSVEIKRTIDELVVRFNLEPELNDVFVEGGFDRDILSASLNSEVPENRPIIYPIDTVDVPIETLNKYGLTKGNKQRVIALFRELKKLGCVGKFLCLVDRDFDHWLAGCNDETNFKWTNYNSIELNFLNVEFIKKVLIDTCGAKINDISEYYASLVKCMSVLFSFRLAAYEMNLSLKWIKLKKYFSRVNAEINFDIETFIDRVVVSSGVCDKKDELVKHAENWASKFVNDEKYFIRGHDLIEAYCWTIINYKGVKNLSRELEFQRLMVLYSFDNLDISSEIRIV